MWYLKKFIEFNKNNKKELNIIKLSMLIIVNLWLVVLFWKILLLNDINLVNNNTIILKASSLLQPVLNILGLDILTPNILKMFIISGVIVISNLSILYFNQMIGLICLGMLGRYSYKSYTNYLINQENISYMGFEKDQLSQMIEKVGEPVTKIVIENPETVNQTNWLMWGLLGLGLVACFGLLIYSHNNLTNSIIDTNSNIQNVNNSLKDVTNHVNERVTRNVQQIDYNNEYTTKIFNIVDNKINLIDTKVDSLESTVQTLGKNLVKVDELGNANVLKLSQQSLNLSHKANEALMEISQATGTVEATTIGLSKVVEIISDYKLRLETMEAKMDSITGMQPMSPRGGIFRNIIPNVKKDE